MYSIGIDVGTTNCKVCLFHLPEFNLVKKVSFTTPKITTTTTSDFDIDLLWSGIVSGLKEISTVIADPENILSIGIASVGEAGVLLDSSDNVIGPVITWYDTRSKPQLDRFLNSIGESSIYEITGIPAHSNYSLNKINWILENEAAGKKPSKWLCLAEFIAFKLSGEKRSEFSLASRTMALDIKNKSWSEEITAKAGLSVNLFSPLVQSGEGIGTLLPSLATFTGLNEKISVAICGHDHMCGSVAVGLTKEDQMLNSTGTTEGLLIVSKNSYVNDEFYNAKISNGIHVLNGLNTLYASLPSAGYAIEWYKNIFDLTSNEFIELVNDLNNRYTNGVLKKSEGIFIPHLRGSGPPRRSIFSRAVLYGIDDKTSKHDVLQYVFEGLCFELKFLLETYEALTNKKYKTIKVIGAACKNEYWLKLKATILNRDIVSYEIDEAVSKGAAILSATGKGHEINCAEFDNDSLHKKFSPNVKEVSAYESTYKNIYKPIYEAKMNVEQLNQLN